MWRSWLYETRLREEESQAEGGAWCQCRAEQNPSMRANLSSHDRSLPCSEHMQLIVLRGSLWAAGAGVLRRAAPAGLQTLAKLWQMAWVRVW